MGWREKQAAKLEGKRVLVVGAGGIGCELLKNIALTGYKDIHVIDMDTIDVSNLNRQFLFRREHVGRSKAEVAAEAIRQLCPDVKISFDLDTIFSSKYNIPFFQQFFVVLNALDNKAARNHVNRMCLAAKTPLIESGSSGYLGQVSPVPEGEVQRHWGCMRRHLIQQRMQLDCLPVRQMCTLIDRDLMAVANYRQYGLIAGAHVRPILRDRTECFECVAKPSQETTFPGCTIRNTPTEHIHCTVWSKHAFNQLFGEVDIDDEISPDLADTGERDENGDAPSNSTVDKEYMEGSAENGVVASSNGSNGGSANGSEEKPTSTRAWAEEVNYNPEKVFDKLFYADITYLLRMKHLWRERRPPVPIRRVDAAVATSASSSASLMSFTHDVNKIWSLADCADVFCESVAALSRRKSALVDGSALHWDKDDEDAMRFVAACANIRATIFGIPCKSLFEIKSMAGNIIPAIATTNAIVAGMVVVEAMKIFSNDIDNLKSVFVIQGPNPRGKILVDQIPFPPNPNCYVCSERRECFVSLNPEYMTVKTLQDKVLRGALNMIAPDVIEAASSNIIISSEEGETSELETKTLAELKIGNGSMLICDDFHQQLELKLILIGCQTMKGDEFKVEQDSGRSEASDEALRKRKSMAPPDVSDEEVAAKRPKL